MVKGKILERRTKKIEDDVANKMMCEQASHYLSCQLRMRKDLREKGYGSMDEKVSKRLESFPLEEIREER